MPARPISPKKHHWNRAKEATRFEHGRSCTSLRSRHLCVLYIRIRKVENEIDTGISVFDLFRGPVLFFSGVL